MGFNLSLGLGLGLGLLRDESSKNCMKIDEHMQKKRDEDEEVEVEDPWNKAYSSLTLGPPTHDANINQQASPSAEDHVSSFSNSSSIIKRERSDDQFTSEELEASQLVVDENGNPKKKLRLTKQQSSLLEDTFKEHSTLHPKEKQELARKLNLRTRQVEVWFQNRRARTKLKQTEVDCEVLKKCYETLTEENKMLQKELKELKSMKINSTTSPEPSFYNFYVQLPVASLTVCPSCKKISGDDQSNNGSSPTTTVLIGPKPHQQHFYNTNHTFTQSSAAC